MSSMLRLSSCGLMAAMLTCAACGGDPAEGELTLEPSVLEDRIIGGAAYVGMPGVGSVMTNGSHRCTGTLIGKRRVLTAAHCLDLGPLSTYSFAIGPDAHAPERTYQVVGGAQHPSWNRQTLVGDIAYLTLDRDASELPFKVLDRLDTSWENVDLTFVGYGVNDGEQRTGSGIKRKVIMPITDVGGTQFSFGGDGKNTCNGDSGGPAFFVDGAGNYLLTGVTSYGDTQCARLGVDTTVPAYLGWLGVTGTAPRASPAGTPASSCDDVTFEGKCSSSSVVTWCEDGHVYQTDCTTRNKTCAYSSADGIYGCAPRPATSDPCNGETYRGRCASSEEIVWCENGKVSRIDCGAHAGTCGFDSPRGIYNCAY